MYVDKVKYLPIIQLSIYISRYEVTYSQFMTLFWKIVFVVIVISSKLEVTWQKTDKNVLHFSTQKTNNIRWQTEPVLGIRSWGSFSRTFLPFKLPKHLLINWNKSSLPKNKIRLHDFQYPNLSLISPWVYKWQNILT